MNAQIITIGDELLIGQTLDTNSHWLAQELTALGFNVVQKISISDKKAAIISALNRAEQMELTIFTGGLGPTNDDITKKVLAEYYKMPLMESKEVLADVMEFISTRGSKMNQRNKMQALIPNGAEILKNHHGTAPGLWFNHPKGVSISLPGVPWEMKGIMQDYGFSALSKRFKLPINYYKTVLFTEIAEAHLADKLAPWEENLPKNINIAYLPSPGIVKLRLGASGNNKANLEQIIEDQVKKLHELMGHKIFGYNKDTLQELVGNQLLISNKTLCVAESCTGGSIAQMLTSIPGSSHWFKGGIVAYHNAIKEDLLKVNSGLIEANGAVSKEVVEAMAKGAQKALNTDYSIATSGIAGPGGGTKEKPVGTVWIAVAGKNTCISHEFKFGNERLINIKRSSLAGLNMLRKFLQINT